MNDPVIELIIKYYALYQAPAQVEESLKKEFGDDTPNYYYIAQCRTKYRQQILNKREELKAKLPIMDVEERWGYMQAIIDDALIEKPIVVKGKVLGYSRNLKDAIAVLKLAKESTETRGAVVEENDMKIRQVVMEAFDDLKKAKPRADHSELVDELLQGLGIKYEPYLIELKENVRLNNTESEA